MTKSQLARSFLAGGLLVGGLTFGLAAPASATGTAGGSPGPWRPYSSGSFTAPAGYDCAFDLQGDPVSDHEQIRTLAVDSSEEPTEQEISGQLIYRYTNEDNGRSVVVNLTGVAWLYHHADGSQTWVISGHFGRGVHPGNPYDPPGYSILTGRTTLQIDAAHHSYVSAHDGPTVDLCAEIS